MGARGPKPGFKRARALAAQASQPAAAPLSAADRENPAKLSGPDLHDHAHRRGLSRSELAGMSDEKIREQLKYITYRQYEAA